MLPFSNDVKKIKNQHNKLMLELVSRKKLVQILSLILILSPVWGCRKAASTNQAQPEKHVTEHDAPIQESVQEARKGDFVAAFGGMAMAPSRRDPNIVYTLDPNVEQFFVHVPEEYTGATAYGLIVFVDADSDSRQLPAGWQTVLDSRKFLYVAPQKAGNDQFTHRRLGLAVLGALEMMKHYRIEPSRVYVAGFSGGSRMAGLLGFFQSDIFHGTIQNCGADFYRPVPVVEATSAVDTAGNPYGLFQASDEEIASARRVHFALITGSQDFRHGNILDLYNGGFAQDGFQARLFDVPGMAHDTADENTLAAALDFVDSHE